MAWTSITFGVTFGLCQVAADYTAAGGMGSLMHGEMGIKMYEYKTASVEALRSKEKHKMAYWVAKMMVV